MRRPLRYVLVCVLVFCLAPSAFGADPDAAKPETAPKQQPLVNVAVVGAPGDGEKALTEALTNRLAAAGIASGSAQATDVYLVEGSVKLAAAKGGRQSVRIDWTVFAPDGRTVGGVSQVKLVRKGSLDKRWGPAADAAASAAASEIAKLLLQ